VDASRIQAMPEVDMLWAVARRAEGAAKENKRGREWTSTLIFIYWETEEKLKVYVYG
jgi:hypothetical protein